MTPHVRQRRSGVWQILFDIGPDPVTGERRQRSRTIHGTETQARAEADRIASELDAGLFIDDGTLTVGQLVDLFLATKGQQVTESTVATYGHALRHLEPIYKRKVSAISGGTLTMLYARLLEQGASPSTVASVHKVARVMFRAAVRWGYMRDDPTFRAEAPRYRPRQMVTWSADDLSAFLAATDGDPLHPAWVLLAFTGMRRGEVCGLQWSDVDLSAGTLTIRRVLKVVDNRVIVGQPKTSSGRRTIALDDVTVEYLRALRASRPTGIGGDEWAWIVAKRDGSSYHPDSLRQAFDRTIRRLELPHIRLHDLRHTYATLALGAGVHVRVVADRLGHSSPSITLNIYSHSTPKLDREAAEAVSRMVGRG